MTARKLGLVILVATWLGCQPETQPSAGNQIAPPSSSTKAGPVVMRTKADENLRLVRLLASETVQKDLGLTAEQVATINKAVKESQARHREYLAKAREVLPSAQRHSPEESESRVGELRALGNELNRKGKEAGRKLLGMLTPSQRERLEQIRLQTGVAAALGRPEIAKALEITAEQSKKIDAISDRFNEELVAKARALGRLDGKERRQKLIDFQKEDDKAAGRENERVLDILTPEQRAKFEKLTGKKINVTWQYDSLIPEDADF